MLKGVRGEKSIGLVLPLNNILFGTEATISPENITDEMKHNDRYDCYSVDGAYHNEAFCKLCDLFKYPINFHKLNDYHFSIVGKEKAEIFVYHSQDDKDNFIAFDLWWGCTDQMGVINIGLYCQDEYWNEVCDLFDIIAQDCFPFPFCNKQIPSNLIESILTSHNDICIFEEREYVIKHIN